MPEFRKFAIPAVGIILIILAGCSSAASTVFTIPTPTKTETGTENTQPTELPEQTTAAIPTATPEPEAEDVQDIEAVVVAVEVSGNTDPYHFEVGLTSPDTGCAQYADWWEVLSEEGELLYRRILLHSHVNEQPFKRSGGPVPIAPSAEVLVRVHMNVGGYSIQAMIGSPEQGFEPIELSEDFAVALSEIPPLPADCDF